MKTLIIDNFDSFTYNLFQLCAELQANPEVIRNDAIDLATIKAQKYTHIIISPGPGTPENPQDFGICGPVIKQLAGQIPILGVCLGHQGIIHQNGGRIIRAPIPVHGKRSKICLKQHPLFQNLPQEIAVMRYHSLIGERQSLPKNLQIIAETPDGLIMAVADKHKPLFGLQFHPESIGTPDGRQIIQNFFQS